MTGGPAVGTEPGEVVGLVFEGDKTTLSWQAEPGAETYNLYRGYIRELSAEFNGVWLDTEISGTSQSDTMKPEPGWGFFNLVTATDAEGDEGTPPRESRSTAVDPRGYRSYDRANATKGSSQLRRP